MVSCKAVKQVSCSLHMPRTLYMLCGCQVAIVSGAGSGRLVRLLVVCDFIGGALQFSS